jgi:hypothetical protein
MTNPKSAQFASDEFSDAYWREFASDTALARSHEHVVVALLPTRQDADALADRIYTGRVTAEVSDYRGAEKMPWQVTVKARLGPSPQACTEFRERLAALVMMRGGRILDGGESDLAQDAGPLI